MAGKGETVMTNVANALLTANKKLLPLLYIWSNVTAYKGGIRK